MGQIEVNNCLLVFMPSKQESKESIVSRETKHTQRPQGTLPAISQKVGKRNTAVLKLWTCQVCVEAFLGLEEFCVK